MLLAESRTSVHRPKLFLHLRGIPDDREPVLRAIGTLADGWFVGTERVLAGARGLWRATRPLLVRLSVVDEPKTMQVLLVELRRAFAPRAVALPVWNSPETFQAAKHIAGDSEAILVDTSLAPEGIPESQLARLLASGVDGVLCPGIWARRLRVLLRNKWLVCTHVRIDGDQRAGETSVSEAVAAGASALVLDEEIVHVTDPHRNLLAVRRLVDAAFTSRCTVGGK